MKHLLKTSLAAALLVVAGCTGDDEANAAPADDSSSEASSETTNDAVADASTPALFLGNANCANTGKAVDQEFFVEHEGQKAYFCGAGCQEKASGDPAAAIVAAYPEATPLGNANCPISGDPVEDGESITWQGQEVGLCCPMCVKGFEKDPDASIAKALAE
ncbi:MAG: hypothetical protein V3T22_12510 [Planctomycetota bacterium]